MAFFIGIDLGTSAVKVLLLSQNGIEKTAERSYPVYEPAPHASEQHPEDWFTQTMEALQEVLTGIDKSQVASLSFSGQMHGLVMLDETDAVIRPAMLWNDGRSEQEVAYLNQVVGKEFLVKHTANIAFAGFTAPKLLWVKNHEPAHFFRARKIMLPKDYLAYRLCGVFATDVGDAAGTLYFDVERRTWSKPMTDLIGIGIEMLPTVYESGDVIGHLKRDIADVLGLCPTVQVIIGTGDNAASAIGTGTVCNGECNISLGTSGTVFVATDRFYPNTENAIHAFCSATGKYHFLACILSAASAQKWWIEGILKTGYDTCGMEQYLGKNRVYFLPYLSGERSPVNDAGARAMFIGMTPHTTREEMSLAVLEGVAFALKQNIEIIRQMGIKVNRSKICGGGARNKLWCHIIANVLNLTLEIPVLEQGGALGAALLAARGVMEPKTYDAFAASFYGVKQTIVPDESLVKQYEDCYQEYLKLYPMQLRQK